MSALRADVNRRILAGTGLQVFARLWSAACGMAVVMLIDRVGDDQSFGAYNYYFSLYQIAFTMIDFGGTGGPPLPSPPAAGDQPALPGGHHTRPCLPGALENHGIHVLP